MALCELQHEVHCITYVKFLPKMFNLKLMKPLTPLYRKSKGYRNRLSSTMKQTDKSRFGALKKNTNWSIFFKESINCRGGGEAVMEKKVGELFPGDYWSLICYLKFLKRFTMANRVLINEIKNYILPFLSLLPLVTSARKKALQGLKKSTSIWLNISINKVTTLVPRFGKECKGSSVTVA